MKSGLSITRMVGSSIPFFFILLTAVSGAQAASTDAWPLLEAGLGDKSSGQRLAAVRTLGLIPNDPHAAELAEKALQDRNPAVRAAAATALGQMRAFKANAALKQALHDKDLHVVLASAHALHLLDDPACYEVYYSFLTGERKDDSGMISQQMKVFRDPKQVAQMGVNEGIGFVPFAGIPWEAWQTISKDKKGGLAAKAALISALGPDPDPRANEVLLQATNNKSWILRVAALEAIAKRGDPTLLPKIESRLSDSRPDVKYAAAATVIHLDDLGKEKPATTKTARKGPGPGLEETTLASTLLSKK